MRTDLRVKVSTLKQELIGATPFSPHHHLSLSLSLSLTTSPNRNL